MSIRTEQPSNRGMGWIFASPFNRGIALEPETGAGSGAADEDDKNDEDDKPADDKKDSGKGDDTPSEKKKGDVSDREAELLREVMDKKTKLKAKESELSAAQERLKNFDGIDPAEVRKLLQEKKDAEKAALEARGDFERLKEMMAEEHAKEKSTLEAKVAEKETALEAAQRTIDDLTVGAAFSGSSFVNDELVLTPSKARQIYGAHFGVENGRVVAYDKPASASNRTMLVNSAGEPLGFEDAVRKLVDADPDRDRIIRSKLKEGAGSKTTDDKKTAEPPAVSGMSRIQLALEKRKAK